MRFYEGVHELLMEGRFQGRRALAVTRCVARLEQIHAVCVQQLREHPDFDRCLDSGTPQEPAGGAQTVASASDGEADGKVHSPGAERLRAMGILQ